MNENFNRFGRYMQRVLDVDRDGVLSVKDFFSLFPSQAVGIAVVVLDLLVAVAEYRVWDVGMRITGGDYFKAAGFVAVSALPFYLGQVLYLYPRASGWQQLIAGGMVLASLWTSAEFGLADLSLTYNVDRIVRMVVWLTFGYVVGLIVYIATDRGIQANRLLTKAQAKAELEKQRLGIVRGVLTEYHSTMQVENQMRTEFPDEAVDAQLDAVRGKRKKKQQQEPPFGPIPPGPRPEWLDEPQDGPPNSPQVPR
jgi:hypothetical protein